jgi:hypothetical protein
MRISERDLRAALDGALVVDRTFLWPTLAKFEELRFLPDDPVLRCASLRARQRTGTGALAIHYSPGGRVLKIEALFSDPEFSATVTYQLPREYWPVEPREPRP